MTSISLVGSIQGRELFRIDQVEFVSLTSEQTDQVSFASTISVGNNDSISDLASPSSTKFLEEHPYAGLVSFLSDSTFYCAYNWDCTKTLQKSLKSNLAFTWESCERSFFWNQFLLEPIIQFSHPLSPSKSRYLQESGIFVICFQGFAQVSDFLFGDKKCVFAVFSRVSCKRAGTRFRSRGIDDDGNVSNFVETETLFAHPEYIFSQIIVRGTVPVFWDQQGFQFGFPKIQLTRTPAASQPAFDRHIKNLNDSYGLVHIIDLLSQKEGQAENSLSSAYVFHVRKYLDPGILSYTPFDVYAICKNSNFERLDTLFHQIGRDLQIFGYLTLDPNGVVVREQKGIFRVNCLDCLDRTNTIQSYIVKRTADLFVRNFLLRSGTSYDASVFQNVLTQLWAHNGDQLSRIYTGSNAIKSSYGRLGRFTFTSFVEDIKNTARRFYSNNFTEKQRQQTIDLFLGKIVGQKLPTLYNRTSELTREAPFTPGTSESTASERVYVQILSWNTNDSIPSGNNDDFSLLITLPKGVPIPHLLVVGFQEIVNLTATQVHYLIWYTFIV